MNILCEYILANLCLLVLSDLVSVNWINSGSFSALSRSWEGNSNTCSTRNPHTHIATPTILVSTYICNTRAGFSPHRLVLVKGRPVASSNLSPHNH